MKPLSCQGLTHLIHISKGTMTTMSTVIITRNNGTVITATSTGVDNGPLGLVLPDGDGHTA